MNVDPSRIETLERRLIALEEMVLHLEQSLGQLNSALVDQQRQIDRLVKLNELLRQRVEKLAAGDPE